ncbi:MAG: YdiU family protein [Myxococcales bacterium]|nr:YdiU family protein [Myxococcales bacterium]
MKRLEELHWDNTFARLPSVFYSLLAPTPLQRPELIAWSPDAAALLDLDPAEAQRPEVIAAFNGDRLLPGMEPLAAIYAGHQFGHFVSQLGDGRAILLGEVKNARGERWDVQVKGAGKTPFSRDGDGRAVLRSTLREYLCSEAMHGLGIPTTRALCILGGADDVYRETVESGALLVRLAPSHVRFGSFELFHHRGEPEQVRRLCEYVIERDFPHLAKTPDRPIAFVAFYEEVVRRTAGLIASWQAVGFEHGVMNTDNMSILGLTLDYGPFGFLDEYDPAWVSNHSDHRGRYAFHRQPSVGFWNASCLGEALLSLMTVDEARAALAAYEPAFLERHLLLMRGKLGLAEARDGDGELLLDLLRAMKAGRADYTRLFRALGRLRLEDDAGDAALRGTLAGASAALDAWLPSYRARLRDEGSDDEARRARMDRVNPAHVLRNHLAQIAIDRALRRDYTEIERLRRALADPFTERPEFADYAAPPPDWSRDIVVSCSS